jgi:hypothetical protein
MLGKVPQRALKRSTNKSKRCYYERTMSIGKS